MCRQDGGRKIRTGTPAQKARLFSVDLELSKTSTMNCWRISPSHVRPALSSGLRYYHRWRCSGIHKNPFRDFAQISQGTSSGPSMAHDARVAVFNIIDSATLRRACRPYISLLLKLSAEASQLCESATEEHLRDCQNSYRVGDEKL